MLFVNALTTPLSPLVFNGLASMQSGTKTTGQMIALSPNQQGAPDTAAQFLFDKRTGSRSLATVYLVNKALSINYTLQTGFDPTNQQCSCYYVDTYWLTWAVNFQNSCQYYLSMVADDYVADSDYFIIRTSTNPIPDTDKCINAPKTTSTTVLPTSTTTSQAIIPTNTTVAQQSPKSSDWDSTFAWFKFTAAVIMTWNAF